MCNTYMKLNDFSALMSMMKENRAIQSVMLYCMMNIVPNFSPCESCFGQDTSCSSRCMAWNLERFQSIFILQYPTYWEMAHTILLCGSKYFCSRGNAKWFPKYQRAFDVLSGNTKIPLHDQKHDGSIAHVYEDVDSAYMPMNSGYMVPYKTLSSRSSSDTKERWYGYGKI